MPELQGTRTYFEMLNRTLLKPALSDDVELRVGRMHPPDPALYRWLYAEIGRDYHWIERLHWTDEQLASHLARAEVRVHLMHRAGELAGYFELCRHPDESIELAYLGVIEKFRARGLGKHLLSVASLEAWQQGAARVFLHTCSFDSPFAIPNYLARGFRMYHQQPYHIQVE